MKKQPQLENGYLKIANEIVDHFCSFRISGEEWLVLWVIIRQTYGWNQKETAISILDFCNMTHLKHWPVVRALKKLESRNIISSHKNVTGSAKFYSVNKNLGSWTASHKNVTPGTKMCLPPSHKNVTPLLSKDNNCTKDSMSRFARPSLSEIEEYCKSKNYHFDPQAFLAHYTSNGWKVGKNPMKCWKAACTTWERNALKFDPIACEKKASYPDEAQTQAFNQLIQDDIEKLKNL